ncbi:MAG: hypothetical protein LDLANPLL_00310 [Turneriella sp.]|nr:hypothetical protein [Turneriella sp.]
MKRAVLFCIPVFWVCSSAPVTLNDNKIESAYEAMLKSSTIKKKLFDIDIASKNFTIEELFVLSLDRTEQLAIAAEKTTAADAQVRKSFGAWLPRVSVIASQYAPIAPGFVVPGVRFSARHNIMTGLNEYTGIVGARLTRVSEEQNLRAQMAAHLLNIADAALQLKLSQDIVEQTSEVVKLSKSNLAEIRRRVSIGRNKRADALKAEALLRQKEADLLLIQQREAQQRRYLAFLTGIVGDFTVNTDVLNFTQNLSGDEKPDLSLRADIALGKTLVDIRKNEATAAFGGHLPNVYLDGSFRPSLDASQPSGYFGGVVAELPLFQGGQVLESQNIAASNLRQAELQLKLAERRALTEIEDARDAYVKTTAEREAYAKSASAAEKNYYAQLSDLRTSIATILDVIQALQDLQTARYSFSNAEYQEKISRLRYFVSLGYLFPVPKK